MYKTFSRKQNSFQQAFYLVHISNVSDNVSHFYRRLVCTLQSPLTPLKLCVWDVVIGQILAHDHISAMNIFSVHGRLVCIAPFTLYLCWQCYVHRNQYNGSMLTSFFSQMEQTRF